MNFASYAPALGLLLVMGLLAWALQWVKKRTAPAGSGQGAELRLVSQLVLGPQQRVVVVEVDGPHGPVQLTLGVTPQHVRTLHTQAVGRPAPGTPAGTAAPTPSYAAVAQALRGGAARQEPAA
ncbi:FliO/MopB family protein [Macromonas nakdongensis]|uniref:FliO/MopB family protein n=1 Tax=Macromonas nakdongensis TaxID=1843082 RepID=UPI000C32529F|nr:flagellar biosynthetic protein FliO [Macromonas nakdongensis]